MCKNYENIKFIIIILFILIILELVFIFRLSNKKLYEYKNYSAVVFSNNLAYVITSKKDTKNFYKNNCLYIDSKKIKYKIDHVNDRITLTDKIIYNQVFIRFKFKKKYRDGDVINISIKDKKVSFLNIFINIWKEDK